MIICPKCGNKLNDDMLYCEVCGTEIQFVPDYEPVIEQSINESLSEIQFSGEDYFQDDYDSEYPEQYSDQYSDEYYEGEYVDDYSNNYSEEYYGENDYIPEAQYIPDYSDVNRSNSKAKSEKSAKTGSQSRKSSSNSGRTSSNTGITSSDEGKNSSNTGRSSSNGTRSSKNGKAKPKAKTNILGNLFDNKKKKNHKAQEEKPEKRDFLEYRRPEALVNIKPPADGPRVSHRLSDSLYDDMYDNDDIQEALDSLGEEYDMDPFDDFAYESYYIRNFLRFLRRSKLKFIIIPLLILIIVAIVMTVSNISKKLVENSSSDYQMQLAAEAVSRQNYGEAIGYLEKAINLTENNSSLKYTLADLYFLNGDAENGILMLWEVINYNDENLPMAYQRIIEYYISQNDFKTVNKILNNCSSLVVKDQYAPYLSPAPEFSVEEGVYESEIDVALSSPAGNMGYIYYTTDGSVPSTESEVYVTPIHMDLGIYKISALYVNQYGIASEIVTKTYTIDMRVPNAPSVMTASGDYEEPELIEVDVQPYTTVFYTTDGTIPNMFSSQYYSPIPMPIGASHFTFVAYSSEGVAGPFTEIDFNLNVDTELDIGAINLYLMVYNLITGRTQDLDGHIVGNANNRYAYTCTSAIKFDETIYYIFNEIIVEQSGKITKTSNMFLSSTEDGSIWNASKDDDAIITLGDVIDPQLYTLPEPEPEGEEGEY